MNIKGDYVFNLKDVPSLLDLGELSFRKGETDGTIEFGGNEKKGYTFYLKQGRHGHNGQGKMA
jgi:hypothetical protein